MPEPTFPRLFSCLLASILLGVMPGCFRSGESKTEAGVLQTAREKMLTFDFNGARDLLWSSRKQFSGDSPDRAEFQYRLALCFWHATPPSEKEVQEAARMLEQVGRDFPDSPFAPAAWLYRGRILDIRDYAGDTPDWEGARKAYQHILETYPDSQEAGEAAVRFGATFMKNTQNKESIAKGANLLAEWLRQNEHRPEASPVAVFLGMAYDYYLPDPAVSLKHYQIADRLGFVNQGRTGAYLWRMHTLAEELGELENAVSYAQRIIRDYARSGRGYEARLSLERMRGKYPELDFTIPTLELFDVRTEEEQ